MTNVVNNNFKTQALERLITQFKGKENIEKLVGLFAEEVQEVQNALFQVLNEKGLEIAEGVQLDQVGALAGSSRQGKSDTLYRNAIKAEIAVNHSKATDADIVEVVRLLTGATDISVEDVYPASVKIFVAAEIETIAVLLSVVRALGAGIGSITFELTDSEEAFVFFDDDTGLGFGDGDPEDSAGVLIAKFLLGDTVYDDEVEKVETAELTPSVANVDTARKSIAQTVNTNNYKYLFDGTATGLAASTVTASGNFRIAFTLSDCDYSATYDILGSSVNDNTKFFTNSSKDFKVTIGGATTTWTNVMVPNTEQEVVITRKREDQLELIIDGVSYGVQTHPNTDAVVGDTVATSFTPNNYVGAIYNLTLATDTIKDSWIFGDNSATIKSVIPGNDVTISNHVATDWVIRDSIVPLNSYFYNELHSRLNVVRDSFLHNLITYSEEFDNAAWSSGGTASVTPNTDTAPDSTLTADTLSFPATFDFIQNANSTIVGGTTYTASIYAKRNSGKCSMRFQVNTSVEKIVSLLNTDNQTLTFKSTSGATHISSTVVPINADYDRYIITGSLDSSTSLAGIMLVNEAAGETGIIAWGAQLEKSDTVGTYLKTTSSQVLPQDELFEATAETAVVAYEGSSLVSDKVDAEVLVKYLTDTEEALNKQARIDAV